MMSDEEEVGVDENFGLFCHKPPAESGPAKKFVTAEGYEIINVLEKKKSRIRSGWPFCQPALNTMITPSIKSGVITMVVAEHLQG